MQARDAAVSHSPSFDSYSNSDLTEIAARVEEECAAEEKSNEFYDDEFYFERGVDSESVKREGEEWDGGDEDDQGFEFEFVTRDSESSTISADEIFHDGKIRPVYPLLNGDFFIRKVKMDEKEENGKKKIRLPLMKLLIEERETAATSSCSSSDVDELEGVPEEMYCVWQPKPSSDADEQESVPEEMHCVWQPKPTPEAAESPEETERRCKKSTSTGSIYKKLKLKELLRLSRSHSEGRKDNFVFLTPKNSWRRRENEYKVEETPVAAGKLRPPPQGGRTYRTDRIWWGFSPVEMG